MHLFKSVVEEEDVERILIKYVNKMKLQVLNFLIAVQITSTVLLSLPVLHLLGCKPLTFVSMSL